MRHRKTGLKLNRTSSHRDAMFRNMVTSLLKHERIRTTDAKAKELRRWADHLITLAKQGDLHARRQALAIVREKGVVHKLFEEAPSRFADLSGGYTRVVKLGIRPGDAAPISLVELITKESATQKPKKKSTKAKGAPQKAAKTETAAETPKEPRETPPPEADAAGAADTDPGAEIQAAEAAAEVEEKAPEPEPEEAAEIQADAAGTEETQAPAAAAKKPKKKTAKKTQQEAEDEG